MKEGPSEPFCRRRRWRCARQCQACHAPCSDQFAGKRKYNRGLQRRIHGRANATSSAAAFPAGAICGSAKNALAYPLAARIPRSGAVRMAQSALEAARATNHALSLYNALGHAVCPICSVRWRLGGGATLAGDAPGSFGEARANHLERVGTVFAGHTARQAGRHYRVTASPKRSGRPS